MRFIKLLAFLTFGLISIVGCGGGGSFIDNSNAFAGAYRQSFFRGGVPDTEMLLVIAPDSTTSFVLSDNTGILYHGTGTTTKDGVVTGSASGDGGTVNITGTCSTAASVVDLSLTGAVTNAVEVQQFSTLSMPFAGSFGGTWTGDGSGGVDITIDSHGNISGTVHRGAGDHSLTGTIDREGIATMSEPGLGATWTGQFYFNTSGTLFGKGTWSDGIASSGTWTVNPA